MRKLLLIAIALLFSGTAVALPEDGTRVTLAILKLKLSPYLAELNCGTTNKDASDYLTIHTFTIHCELWESGISPELWEGDAIKNLVGLPGKHTIRVLTRGCLAGQYPIEYSTVINFWSGTTVTVYRNSIWYITCLC